uniref:Spondin domain-containing protein n=1 Tax=Alexandrium monilatum TaxID=311494 RepID=A0A7S4SU46_9DINO
MPMCIDGLVMRGKSKGTVIVLLGLLLTGRREAARPTRKSEVGGSVSLDKDTFNEQVSHLHVHPSTHRSSRRREGESPFLVVTFALHATARTLLFVLPPGYLPVIDSLLPTSCGIFTPSERTNYSAYSRATGAQPLAPHISECQLKPAKNANKTEIVLQLCEGVDGLSLERDGGPGHTPAVLKWWFFHLHAWNPDDNPSREDNVFELHWSETTGAGWAGSTQQQGDPVLGDWDCAYADWEHWGGCSARCGGGVQRLRRRILLEPPPGGSGIRCTETVERSLPCSTHPCVWPCEHAEEIRGHCSAECGGGVRIVRMRWHGEHCPDQRDPHAIRREACNTQPCRPRCELDDKWTVVTPCSEHCGPGYFWMMRTIVAKESNDDACQPEWRRLPCLRQHCTPLTVLRPDVNIRPYPEDTFQAAVLFKVPVLARVIQLNAPEGFSFGDIGQDCTISSHDLAPHFDHCEVGVRESQAVIKLSTPLPPTYARAHGKSSPQRPDAAAADEEFDDRHQLTVSVRNAPCKVDQWVPDIMVTTMTCDIPPDNNRWVMEFGEDATTRWESLSTESYPLYWPHASGEIGQKAGQAREQPAAKASSGDAGGEQNGSRRPEFCSARIACKDPSAKCGRNGICQPR